MGSTSSSRPLGRARNRSTITSEQPIFLDKIDGTRVCEGWARESFQIKLRSHRNEPVEIRVREHLFRWSNWEITAKSDPFVQKDANTIEFNVPIKPGEEHVVSYTVLYTKLPRAQAGQ